jgi:hypothetical protein
MRMYCEKTRARSPVLIFWPATDLLGPFRQIAAAAVGVSVVPDDHDVAVRVLRDAL